MKAKSRIKRRYNVKRVIATTAFTFWAFYFTAYGVHKFMTEGAIAVAPGYEPKIVEKQVEVVKEVEVDRTFTTEKQQIMAEIIEVFGDDAPRAIAVAKAESGFSTNVENRGKANPKYLGECSIGIYQINLASDGCEGKKVHWDKVPGNTLEEKVAWLKVPSNNIKLAKKIYDSHGKSFQPWGAFSSGAYKGL